MATVFKAGNNRKYATFSLNVSIVTGVTKTAPIVRIVTMLQLFLLLLLFGGNNA